MAAGRAAGRRGRGRRAARGRPLRGGSMQIARIGARALVADTVGAPLPGCYGYVAIVSRNAGETESRRDLHSRAGGGCAPEGQGLATLGGPATEAVGHAGGKRRRRPWVSSPAREPSLQPDLDT